MIGVAAGLDGRICIACDHSFRGRPVFLGFQPERRTLFLQFEDGRREDIGTSGVSQISALLHKTRTVRFLQIGAAGESRDMELPLYVQMDGVPPNAIAV